MPLTRITRVAAYGLIIREHRILLCRISDEVPKHAGYWTLPGGGIEFGEDPEDAVVREVFEETGLHVRPTELLKVNSIQIEEHDKQYHSIRLIYRTELLGGTLTDEVQGSTDRCSWWSHKETRELPLVSLAELGVSLVFESLNSRRARP